MAVNESIYVPVWEYNGGSSVDEITDVMITTDTVPDILTQNLEWQAYRLLDDSNVYTTFDPKLFPNLFGSTITRMNLGYGKYAPTASAPIPSTDRSAGVKSIEMTPSTDKVNLRYIMVNANVYLTQMVGYRWTNLDPGDLLWQKEQIRDMFPSAGRKEYDNPYDGGKDKSTGGTGVAGYGKGDFAFVTEIHRDTIMYNVIPRFSYIDGISLKSAYPPVEVYREWLLNDKTGFLKYDGHECFVTDITSELYYDQPGERRHRLSRSNGNHMYRHQVGESKDTGVGSEGGCCLSVLCERVVGKDTYYYTIPINGNEYGGGTVGPVFTTYTRRGTQQVNNAVYPSNHGPTITDSTNPYNTFFSAFTMGTDIGINYEDSFMLYGVGSGTKYFPEDSQREKYEDEPSYRWYTEGQTLFSESVENNGESTKRRFSVQKHLYSGQEILAMFACLLIPFFMESNSQTIDYEYLERNDVKFYLGIREEDGCVAGRYQEWKFKEDPVEEELRPDDFKPYEPQPEPDPSPSNPPDSDRTKGDSGTIKPVGQTSIGASFAFCTHYVLEESQLTGIGKGLWGGVDPKDVLKNFWYFNSESTDYQMSYSEILDYLVSLKYFPFGVIQNNIVDTTGENGIRIGNGTTLIPDLSTFPMETFYLINSVMELDGGYVTIPHETGSYLDHEPCSVASVYVPFCGTAELKLSNVTGKELHLRYFVDLITGCCKAVITMNGEDGEFPVAQLDGVCGFEIMMTGNNQNQQLSAIMSAYRQTALGVGGNIMSAIAGGVTGGLVGGAAGAVAGTLGGLGGAVQEIANTAINMPQTASLHPMSVGTSSSFAQLCGYMEAFVQVTRVTTQTPSNYNNTVGYIQNQAKYIRDISGFTQCVNPDLNGIIATEQEKIMISNILESGFYA